MWKRQGGDSLKMTMDKSRVFIFVGILAVIMLVYNCQYFATFKSKLGMAIQANRNSNGTPHVVRLLLWSSYFGVQESNRTRLWKRMGLANMECGKWCELVADRNLVNQSDALIFHGSTSDMNLAEMPKFRNIDQPWVWWFRESPYFSTKHLQNFNGLFNWTMTYRQDSDVVYSYGETVSLSHSRKSAADLKWMSTNVPLNEKSKLIVAVMSNCHSFGKREKLIEQLKGYNLTVDIYGKCGTPVAEPNPSFWSRLQKQYKFYLAFENALCTDYVTEKFWRTLSLGMVPIVYGGGDYSRIAPPHSFINPRDFNSTKNLAEFIKKLDKNAGEYKKYFEWRKAYRVVQDESSGFCALCRKIRANRKNKAATLQLSRKLYNDLYTWWMIKPSSLYSACSPPENERFWKELQ